MSRPAVAVVRLLLVAAAIVASTGATVAAQFDPTGDEARELAERYAPIVRVATQDFDCDADGEAFAPMPVDVVLGNADVMLRQAGVGDPVVTRAPEANDLFGRGPGFFLDFNGLALTPECTYERDFKRYNDGDRPLVYAHVVTQPDEPGLLALQYWLYWYYNDWNNKHESDWEFIQLLFEADDVTAALSVEPVEVGYAQHEGGETASWDSDKLERIATHPVVYSSRGSHASYFASSVFLGRKGTEGFGCDTTAEDTTELRPGVDVLPHTVSDAGDEHAWLGFTGRWGERRSGPFNGPTGPNTKPQWDRPVDWIQDLRSASVEIPGADETNGTILDTFCAVVGFGSDQLRQVQVSPLKQIAFIVVAGVALWLLVRSTVWTSTPPVPLRRRRHVGQMIRSSLASYGNSRGVIPVIALCYLPPALLIAVIGSFTSFGVAQSAAALLTTAMIPLVTALIAAFWDLRSKGDPHRLAHSFDLVGRRLGQIAIGSLWSAAIIAGLSITIIGLPFAIRQLVRYQFVVPVITTEGVGGRAALGRSSALVEGHWWHSAIPLAALAGIAFVINSSLQLGLLVILAGVPLWAYAAITFFVTGLVVPIVATAPVLLYGDAVARAADPLSEVSEPIGAPA